MAAARVDLFCLRLLMFFLFSFSPLLDSETKKKTGICVSCVQVTLGASCVLDFWLG